MEAHPLNLAHQQHRRADAHLKNNRFDESVHCHSKSAELLLEALNCTTSSIASESINLQYNYHIKQIELIKNKKEQYTKVKKALEDMKMLQQEV